MEPNSFRSTVLGASSNSNGNDEPSDNRRRAFDILNPEPEPASSAAAARASSTSSSHASLRSPSKPEPRPLASPGMASARGPSPAASGLSLSNLLNNGPESRSRSPVSAAPAQREKGKFYDPLTDTVEASPSADRHYVSTVSSGFLLCCYMLLSSSMSIFSISCFSFLLTLSSPLASPCLPHLVLFVLFAHVFYHSLLPATLFDPRDKLCFWMSWPLCFDCFIAVAATQYCFCRLGPYCSSAPSLQSRLQLSPPEIDHVKTHSRLV